MNKLAGTIANLNQLDEIARQQTPVHQLHPVTKLLTTIIYLVAVTSFPRDTILGLLPMVFFPVLLFSLAEIPVWPILRRVFMVEPLILGVGLLNPVFDQRIVMVGNLAFSHGWLTLLSILIKGSLTVIAALLLIATSGMNQISTALRMLKVPRLLVTIIVLIYRYISVLAGETARTLRAYALRSPRHPGVRFKAWGSLTGQLLLRSFDRADRLYQAMTLRGFTGDFPAGNRHRFSWRDAAYFLIWVGFFILARLVDLPALLGYILSEVIS